MAVPRQRCECERGGRLSRTQLHRTLEEKDYLDEDKFGITRQAQTCTHQTTTLATTTQLGHFEANVSAAFSIGGAYASRPSPAKRHTGPCGARFSTRYAVLCKSFVPRL